MKADDSQRLVKPFQSFQDGVAKSAKMVSALHTTRLAAYGFTSEADVLGIDTYQINAQMDALVCPICAAMHGKQFTVESARTTLVSLMQVSDPTQLKYMNPWPKHDSQSVSAFKELTNAQLVANWWHIPPFHGWCRCQINKVGTVPAQASIELPSYTATEEDFTLTGVDATPETVDTWNTILGTHPADMAAAVTGDTAVSMVEDALNGNTNAFQIDKIEEVSGGIHVKASGTLQGAANSTAEFTVDNMGVVKDVSFVTTEGANTAATSFLKEFIPYLEQSKANSLVLDTYVNPKAWLKLGFVPADLPSAIATVQENLIAYTADHAVPDAVVAGLNKLLTSNDPEAFWAIADISTTTAPGMADALLGSLTGALVFDFNNTDANAKFKEAML